jgi:hypothetical protein
VNITLILFDTRRDKLIFENTYTTVVENSSHRRAMSGIGEVLCLVVRGVPDVHRTAGITLGGIIYKYWCPEDYMTLDARAECEHYLRSRIRWIREVVE